MEGIRDIVVRGGERGERGRVCLLDVRLVYGDVRRRRKRRWWWRRRKRGGGGGGQALGM